jgi:hypothetical protein
MYVTVTNGSLSTCLGLAGTGVAMMLPDQRWIGGVIIALAVLTLLFDVRIERGHVRTGSPLSFWQRFFGPRAVRVSVTDLLTMASRLGWDFVSHESLQLLDMQEAIRQGGLDGKITVVGRNNRWTSESLVRNEPLDKIKPDHWRDHFVHLFAARENDNFNTYSWMATPQGAVKPYVDLHVERAGLMTWLKNDAASFRGKKKK